LIKPTLLDWFNMAGGSAPSMAQRPPSGIDVLIVGTGIGGLFAAVEMHRKGHSVRVIEAKDGLEEAGKNPWCQLEIGHHD
jgi:cation diffusion facilitator CzcD-associated flavoprotein CzcO